MPPPPDGIALLRFNCTWITFSALYRVCRILLELFLGKGSSKYIYDWLWFMAPLIAHYVIILELKSLSLDITGEVSDSSPHQQGSTNHCVYIPGAAIQTRTHVHTYFIGFIVLILDRHNSETPTLVYDRSTPYVCTYVKTILIIFDRPCKGLKR